MRALILGLAGATGLLASPVTAQDPLPDRVAGLYATYQQAEQSGDVAVALEAARAVYRAARRARVDDATLATLAENLGFYAAAAGDSDQAYDAWRASAELTERSEGQGLTSGYRWQQAALAAFAEGDQSDARRCAMNASNGYHAAGMVAPELRDTSAQAHLLAAQLSGTQGKFSDAGQAAERALELFLAEGRGPDRYLALAYYNAGVSEFFDREYFDAAVKLHLAADMFEYANLSSPLMATEGDTARTMARLAVRAAAQRVERNERSDEFSEAARGVSMQILAEVDANPHHGDIRGLLDGAASDAQLPEGAIPARALYRIEPFYPERAAVRGDEGLVLVRFTIDETGRVVDAEITGLFGARDLGEASLEAVSQWSYEPATLNGEPIRVEGVETQFNFTMSN